MSPSKTLERSSDKTARQEARITRTTEALFLRAAQLTARSLTDFVIVASAQETASRTLREHDTLMLSTLDRKAFVEALLHPGTRCSSTESCGPLSRTSASSRQWPVRIRRQPGSSSLSKRRTAKLFVRL